VSFAAAVNHGVAHKTSAATCPTTRLFIPFSNPDRPVADRPHLRRGTAPAAPLKNPKSTINYCALQKNCQAVAQTVQRKPHRWKIGRNFSGLCARVYPKKTPITAALLSCCQVDAV
jgi:hypothetical protein